MHTVAQNVNGHNGTYPAGMTQTQSALAEAACSVNVFFEIEGYGKAQATGRGRNAKEAAANLKATIAETRAALTPPAPMAPVQTRLGDLLACGLAKAVAKGDMARVERLTKAAVLVLANAVHPAGLEGHYTVDSRTKPGVWYDTTASSCGCQDYQQHATGEEPYFCLHILACLMTHRLETTP